MLATAMLATRGLGLKLSDKSHQGDHAQYENEDCYYLHTPCKPYFVQALILFYPGLPQALIQLPNFRRKWLRPCKCL